MEQVKKFVCYLGLSTAKWMLEDKRGKVPSVHLQRANNRSGNIQLIRCQFNKLVQHPRIVWITGRRRQAL